MARELIYFDTEYRDNGRDPVMAAFVSNRLANPVIIDTRDHAAARQAIQTFLDGRPDAVLVAHELAADLGVLLTLGVVIAGRDCIDTRAEVRMLALSHPDFDLPRLYAEHARKADANTATDDDDDGPEATPKTRYGYSLLESLWLFGIEHETDQAEKDACRDLILYQDSWTAAEWRRIEVYCVSDVLAVRKLMPKLHAALVASYDGMIGDVLAEMVTRGAYIRDCEILRHRSKGFPIDVQFLTDIYENRQAVINGLSEACNAHYGHPIYVSKGKKDPKYSFSFAGFGDWLAKLDVPIEWDLTECRRFKFQGDYVDQQVAKYPGLKTLKETRDGIRAMSSTDLRTLLTSDGYIVPRPNPLHTVTGRNGPRPKEGFILNLMPWQRSVIRPHEGQLILGADWSQQEIAIAAALSGDDLLIKAFLSGDVYLAMAKEAGAVPPDGTKKSHPVERQAYKAVVLGLGYGKGKAALGVDIWLDLGGRTGNPTLTQEEAAFKASEIYDWHKATYWQYWDWIAEGIEQARMNGFWRTADGWTRFVGDERHTRTTALMNYPIQSAGGLMLRRAVAGLARTDLDVICSHHDAIYLNTDPTRLEADQEVLLRCMDAAAISICGHNIPIQIDTHVYDHQGGYWDDRGAAMHATVTQHIAAAKARAAQRAAAAAVVETRTPLESGGYRIDRAA